MKLTVTTTDPAGLLAAIRQAIDEKQIIGWGFDPQGDLTQADTPWDGQAWLRPTTTESAIDLDIFGSELTPLTPEIIGNYYGRFLELLANYFSSRFTRATYTP